jgi:LEA14-like dessication related protein
MAGDGGHSWHLTDAGCAGTADMTPRSACSMLGRQMKVLAKHFLPRIACLALLLLAISGCASLLPADDRVRVTVSDIRVEEATLMEQLYRVTLRVQNRSDRPLVIRGGSFDLDLNGREFASGVSDSAVEVPAYGDVQIDVSMVSTVFGFVRLFRGLQQEPGDPLRYRISGHLATGGLAGVRFEESGEIDLRAAGG